MKQPGRRFCRPSSEEREENTMKRLKWTMNGVTFQRSNYRPLIARFDNSKCWLAVPAITTTSGFRSLIRQLAADFGASTVELKYFYDEEDRQTETEVVCFDRRYSEEKDQSYYVFRNELRVPPGTPRKFIEYTPEDIFEM